MPTKVHPILVLIFLLTVHFNLVAQCPPAISAPACTGSEPLVIPDEIIPSGITKWHYGAASMINSLTMRGGKLVVCGTLTIDKFYMDSGQVIVNPGARLVIASGDGAGLILKGNSAMYNFGTLEIQRNLSLDNGWATATEPNIIVNATTSSVFKMSNQYFVINNAHSWFVNKGRAEFWGIITDNQSSPNCICLGITSVTTMAVLINKVPNTYTVTLGSACVYVHQFSQFFGRLTSTPGVMVCLSSSHNSDASCIAHGCQPNNWGDARVFTNCSSCATIATLPARFTSFEIAESRNRNILKWELESDLADFKFYIERSSDGQRFQTIDSLEQTTGHNFSYIDNTPQQGLNYYRVKAVELHSRQAIASKIISSLLNESPGMKLYPSPFSSFFFIEPFPGESITRISVHDISGKNVPVIYRRQDKEWRVSLTGTVPKQVLIVNIVTSAGTYTRKIMHTE